MPRRGPRAYYDDDERPAPEAPAPLTVSQIVKYVQLYVGREFRAVTIVGEVSQLKEHGGHWYFSLKDAQHALPCVMFRMKIREVKFAVKEGMRVVAHGQVTVYTRQTKVQLEVRSLELVGAGTELVALEALKQKLRAEGLFEPGRKRALPLLPRRVGVVTSGGGAVLHDVIQVARARLPGVSIVLSSTRVGGKAAGPEIARALRLLDERGGCDVIIIGRGGGSAEDLAGFQDERVARAIADCSTPVVSAVGHESDNTLADLVADVRAATPSNAAELAVPSRKDLHARLRRELMRLDRGRERIHADAVMRLKEAERELDRAARLRAQREHARLDALRLRLAKVSPRAQAEARVDRTRALIARLERANPRARLQSSARALTEQRVRLQAAGAKRRATARRQLAVAAARLDALSPLKVLERGFVVVERGDETVTRSAELKRGDEVELRFSDGRVKAEVKDAD